MDSTKMSSIVPENEEKMLRSLPVGQKKGSEDTAAPERQKTMPGSRSSFGKEVSALLERYPELREKIGRGEEIPREVLEICARTGISLRTAYAEYAVKQAKAEIERLQKENKILKQNAAAAAKAPVRGATAGGNDNKGKDPFLEGLLSED